MKNKVIVVMPAYNAAKTLERTYKDIPKKIVDEVIVVDDDSHDTTINIAKKLRLPYKVHSKNLGYGANQKTCYKEALKREASIIVMIHPDYQYDPKLTGELIYPIINKRFDLMLGSRITTRQDVLKGGMPFYKYLGNRFLTFVENIILGLNLSEYHTGFRAYKAEVLKKIPYKEFSDDFVFDQEILFSARAAGFRIGEISVPTRYFREASSINFLRSIRYGLETLLLLCKYIVFNLNISDFKIFQFK